jgi:cyclopropane fatty-acyl-phospholipid synthase-like methyltransferase
MSRSTLFPLGLLLAGVMACGGADAPPAQAPAESHAHDHHGAHEHGDHAGEKHDGPIGHRFENAEDWVDRFDGPERDAWQKPQHVIELIGVVPGMTVADVGAGTGYFAPHLSAAVGDDGTVLALDVEQSMVDYIGERAARDGLGNVEARVVAFDDPQLPEAGVDRLIVVNTWHHIPDREAYAAKLAAGLRPGGMVFVIDFTMDSERGPPKHHRLQPAAVVAELAAGGLDAEVLAGESLEDQYVVVGRLP